MDIKIIIASHKEYPMPAESMYLPVLAGAALCESAHPGFVRDDTGDHISERNNRYSELSALYWAWKNLPAQYLGLCHYRRYLSVCPKGRNRHILRQDELEPLLKSHDIVLANERNYVIETNYSQYIHAHHKVDLDLTREVIADLYPDYLQAYDRRMAMTRGHRFNLFVMRRDLADQYCQWLFDILFELEKRLDVVGYEGRDARVYGLVSERLIDVWFDARGLTYAEVSYMMTEKEHLIRKGLCMIGRKIRGSLS